jgi:hypothetical protein
MRFLAQKVLKLSPDPGFWGIFGEKSTSGVLGVLKPVPERAASFSSPMYKPKIHKTFLKIPFLTGVLMVY